ncbi:Dolichyl-diphosphooligosaccharide--protein glycosyltransferase subunit Swp1 [Chytriomyces sp. MP71]|nr:Dolichyl-diphosphooligosaccharide--protein glycosyltransferase subunit Swp1 [Chytriomyces sp. MP71]
MGTRILAALVLVLAHALSVSAVLTTAVVVLARDGSQVSQDSVAAPALLKRTVHVNDDQGIAFMVADDDKLAKDVLFAHFAHSEAKDVEASFALDNKKGKHMLTLDFGSQKKNPLLTQFKRYPGEYTLSIYTTVASPDLQPIEVGKVQFDVTPIPEAHVLGSTEKFEPVHEIFHIFRKPEKMPNALVSIVFAALVIVGPWGLLLLLWSHLNVNITDLSQSPTNSLWGSAFLAALAACATFYYVYWMELNLFQLLGYGSVVWSMTAFLGYQALVTRASLRIKAEKAKK